MDRMYSLNVYETPTHFYIIGSDPSGSRFRTLKIDRIAEKEFIAGEPDHDYSQADIGELLATVSSSSIVTPTEKWSRRRNFAGGNGLLRTVEKAYGLIGTIRFLEGYYLLVVSRAKQVAQIGYHAIYKVDDVSMIYLPASGATSHPDELKYSKLFQTVDFTTNFYFSYTYHLSRTLQENCLAERGLDWNRNSYRTAMRGEKKFVWNDFLLEPLRRNKISNKWMLELMHGYIGHQRVELRAPNWATKLDMILVARRSTEFAGTRFLKRGTNYNGAVANDVETEQIVWNISEQSFRSGKFSAFVQRRGSVPLFWSQSSAHRGAPMVVGKPPIVIDRVEPHALTTAQHFRELRRKYGHPVTVLNLVKRNEHKHNENLLHDIFLKTVRYLNQFRQPGRCIDYISFDVSRCNKTGRVLQRLEELGQRTVLATGWFQSFPALRGRSASPDFLAQQRSRGEPMPAGIDEAIARYQTEHSADGQMQLQHGIVRANCVDCLDRTNVAQFGLGKAALGWQLFSMGLLPTPWSLGLHTEVCRLFEELFDEHGDTLAWQYAGSQLVHSIKTYKRTAVFQERSRDVLQTLSRYYSNTFSDCEKQDGINLFLGIFRVREGQPPIWSLGSDHYLHFPVMAPKRNEFLRWSVSVSSDNEDEDWLVADKEFRDWVLVKAREGQDIRVDNNWVEIESDCGREEKSADRSSANAVVLANNSPDLFELAYRTFEFTSLEQLVRQAQQMELRRPVTLEALDQCQQSSTFMWMFKQQAEHSLSPPPSVRKTSNASSFSASAGSSAQAQVVLSSLAAGTASIVRDGGGSGKKQQQQLREREEGKTTAEDGGETDDDDADDIDNKVRDRSGAGTLLLASLDWESRQQQFVALNASPASAASLTATSQQLPVAMEEDLLDREMPLDTDLLVIEDRNGPAERENDPFLRFQALLGDGGTPRKEQRRPSPSSGGQKRQLGLGTGLKSPREVYFGGSAAGTTPTPLLVISDQDMALYSHYMSAAPAVFERHNLRRQRRPTVWKLPNPLKNIRRAATPSSASSSPKTTGAAVGRSLPLSGRKQRKSAGDLLQTAKSSTPTAKKTPPPPQQQKTTQQSSPFRKDFCQLGPVFRFKPSLFTVDSAFHTELGEVPEESLRLYRRTVEMARKTFVPVVAKPMEAN